MTSTHAIRFPFAIGAVLAASATLGAATNGHRPQAPPPAEKPLVTAPASPARPAAGQNAAGSRGTTTPPSAAIPTPFEPVGGTRISPLTSWEQVATIIDDDPRRRVWSQPVLRVGQDYELLRDATTRDTVVVFGSARIDGFINGDLTVTLGSIRLGPGAVVTGSVVVVGGNFSAESGAMVRRDLIVIGGRSDTPPGFSSHGGHVLIGAPAFGERLRAFVPWIVRGAMWGRPIVPDLAWVWWIAAVACLVYLLIVVLFHDPVADTVEVLQARPLNSFMAALLVLLLIGPLTVLLAVSVIGVLVLPFVLCAIVVMGVIGKAAVACALGARVWPASEPASRGGMIAAFLIGSAIIYVLYLVPVLGIAAWALTGLFGLGAATLAFFSALRRERRAGADEHGVPPVPPVPPAPQAPRAPVVAVSAVASQVAPAVVPPVSNPGAARPFSEGAAFAPAMAFAAAAATSGGATNEPAVASERADLRAFPRATFLDRLSAFGLDLLLVLFVSQWLSRGRSEFGDYVMFALLYYAGAWAWKGTTIGGVICNLRVVRADGAPLRLADAVVRALTGLFSILALGLGGLWILRDPHQQAWHDKISATLVVKVPADWPLP